MKKILLSLALIFAFLTLFACTPGGGGEDTPKTYKVMVIENDGITITGDNPVTVEEGGKATFTVAINEGYAFESVSAGTYDTSAGTLTVSDVKADVAVKFTVTEVDTSVKYQYFFAGTESDTTSVTTGSEVYGGAKITLNAGDTTQAFLGWSSGAALASGGKLLSMDRSYTVTVGEEVAKDGIIVICANYSAAMAYSYDANGGTVNSDSVNFVGNDKYYTCKEADGVVTVTLKEAYYTKAQAASLMWDDGTFTREGYILKEYNTKADGSGVGYSLGSKYYIDFAEGGTPTLYCIWAKETPASEFTYEEIGINMPDGVTVAKAPHWSANGIKITGYTGNDKTVVIPEKIGDKFVTAIGGGAFTNKNIEALVMGRRILKIEDGAFVGCSELKTVYYPDGIYYISNAAFDEPSYSSLKNFYVNATIAPRFATDAVNGPLAYKLSKLMATSDKNRIIVIGGSSVLQGLGTEYLEALLSGEYEVINFGTTRTTNGLVYLEAVKNYVHDGDIVLYSPENSIYMMGENELYWKTLRDMEGMYNLWRDIDVSGYENVLSAFADFNQSYRYKKAPTMYEEMVESKTVTPDGDRQDERRAYYRSANKINYVDSYYITLNERVKSKDEGEWSNAQDQLANKDYTNPDNPTWVSFTAPEYKVPVNEALEAIKGAGAKTYFAFPPADANAVVPEAKDAAWIAAYDNLILTTYTALDGILGSSADYIYDHEYFYDCALHLNDYGRTIRTYDLYLDIAKKLGITSPKGMKDVGESFVGCLFPGQNAPEVEDDFISSDVDGNAKYFNYEKLADGSYKIVGLTYLGTVLKTITIPTAYNGAKVTVLGAGALNGVTARKVIIPEKTNLTAIEDGAFLGASSVSELWIYFTDTSSGDERILPPSSFAGVGEGFTVHVPEGSGYATDYFWSERGLTFVEDANL